MISEKTHHNLANSLNRMTTILSKDHSEREYKSVLNQVMYAIGEILAKGDGPQVEPHIVNQKEFKEALIVYEKKEWVGQQYQYIVTGCLEEISNAHPEGIVLRLSK